MRTTVRMDDELLRRAKAIAAQRDTTLTAILEHALRDWLDRQRRAPRRPRVDLPVSRAGFEALSALDRGAARARLAALIRTGAP